jgi:hypothetical protein
MRSIKQLDNVDDIELCGKTEGNGGGFKALLKCNA